MKRIGVVTSDGLNLHETIGGDIIDELGKGDHLEILESRKLKVEWLRVRVIRTSQMGWVAARFVKITEVPGPKPPRPQQPGAGALLFWTGIVVIAGVILWQVAAAIVK